MEMKCKVGDLAYFIGKHNNRDKFVTIKNYLGYYLDGSTIIGVDGKRFRAAGNDYYFWVEAASFIEVYNIPERRFLQYKECCAGDSILRPIRDQPGDEKFITEIGNPTENAIKTVMKSIDEFIKEVQK